MYCRNCGNLLENDTLCRKCGFDGNDGNKFCPHCGKEVMEKQQLCLNCGCMINEKKTSSQTASTTENNEQLKHSEQLRAEKESVSHDAYKKYTPIVKKNSTLLIVRQIIAALIVLIVVFAPIFKSKTNVSDMSFNSIDDLREFDDLLTDVESTEDAEELFEKGYVEKEFSIFDEVKNLVTIILDESTGEEDRMIAYTLALFYFLSVFAAIMVIVSIIKNTHNAYSSLENLENATMLEYDELKKSGDNAKKLLDSFNDEGKMLSILGVFVVMDAVMGIMMRDIPGSSDMMALFGNTFGFSGVTIWAFFAIALCIVHIVVKFKYSKNRKEMLLSVTKEKYLESEE